MPDPLPGVPTPPPLAKPRRRFPVRYLLLLAGVVVTLLARRLPGNLTSVFAGKGRVPLTPTPALSAPASARVGNDGRTVRHPDGRVELTGSLIRVEVVPLTLTPTAKPKKRTLFRTSLRNWITSRAGSSRFLSALCFGY